MSQPGHTRRFIRRSAVWPITTVCIDQEGTGAVYIMVGHV